MKIKTFALYAVAHNTIFEGLQLVLLDPFTSIIHILKNKHILEKKLNTLNLPFCF